MNMPEDVIVKATITQLYTVVEALRHEIFERFDSLEVRMASSFASAGTCDERHLALQERISDAILASEKDREKLWSSVHATEKSIVKLLWWLVGVMAAFISAIVVSIVTGHLTF
jgi:hypothetical protein